ncbi:hypothetical protein PODOV061v2_0061 [Vibrio phage 172P1]|nr:hypothetical protein PODOV061v2_0061 [Vibrio phage 172P1]
MVMIYLGMILVIMALILTIAGVLDGRLDDDKVLSYKLEQVILICLCSGISLLVISS